MPSLRSHRSKSSQRGQVGSKVLSAFQKFARTGSNSQLSLSFDTDFLNTGPTNLAGQSSSRKGDDLNWPQRPSKAGRREGPAFFTTGLESGHIVFRQFLGDQAPDGEAPVSPKLLKATLRYGRDCQLFLAGAYRTAASMASTDSEPSTKANLRLYNFDRCISEY